MSEEVKKIKEKYERQLLDVKGVVGVGFNGSVVVYVEKLTPQVASFIPRTLDGISVHIIETGKVKLLSFPIVEASYQSRAERVRPLIGGISVGHPEATAGTLSCGVRDKASSMMLGLSNNHVIALDWGEINVGTKGDSVLQPGVYDGGTVDDKVGELERWQRVELDESNIIDAALFSNGEIDSVLDTGKPSNAIEPKVGMTVKKSGRTSGLTFGKIIDVNATLIVEGWGNCLFKDQVVVSPHFSLPGDSGSWVGDENDRTVGLVFAGSTEVTIINKATNIESILGIEFAPELPYIPLWAAMIPIPALLIGAVAIKGGNKN